MGGVFYVLGLDVTLGVTMCYKSALESHPCLKKLAFECKVSGNVLLLLEFLRWLISIFFLLRFPIETSFCFSSYLSFVPIVSLPFLSFYTMVCYFLFFPPSFFSFLSPFSLTSFSATIPILILKGGGLDCFFSGCVLVRCPDCVPAFFFSLFFPLLRHPFQNSCWPP